MKNSFAAIVLAISAHHTRAQMECDSTYDGQQDGYDLLRVGDQQCQIGEKIFVARYDMFNGAVGSHFYWDETYSGFGVSEAGPIAADGSVPNTDPEVLKRPSHAGLMHGRGQLADDFFPTVSCCNGGGTYPDPSSTDYPYVAWDAGYLNNDIGFPGVREVPMTFFFDWFRPIDFITLSGWTRAGKAKVCTPSGAWINGEFYDLSDAEATEDLTNFHLQIALPVTIWVNYMDIILDQHRKISCGTYCENHECPDHECPNGFVSPDVECAWIFLSEVEFHSCGEDCWSA